MSAYYDKVRDRDKLAIWPNIAHHNPEPAYLRSLLSRARLSQRAAAKQIGINERTMRYYLSGQQSCPYPVQFCLEAIAEAVDSRQKELDEKGCLPHRVVHLHIVEGIPLIKAWRTHLRLTQETVASRLGITQSAYSQIENSDNHLEATLEKLAAAFGVSIEQLRDLG